MHTIYRNLLSIFRRFKIATLFNLCGLAVAFAAFMTILMQVEYDYTFDHFDPNHSRIFRVEFVHKEGGVQAILSRPMIETLIASSPHIQAGTYQNMDYDFVFSIENGADKKKFRELYQTVSPGFTDVFHFDFVEGSPDVLKTPDQVMIPESMARKIFGQESAVGKKLINPYLTLTVGAVYRDFPDNTLVSNVIYHAISEQENKTNWGNWNYTAFIRVDDAANLPTIEENFKKHFTNVLKEQFGAEGVAEWEAVGADLRFTPLPDVHFVSDVQFDNMPKANAQALHVLTAIAFVVLLIAGINFTNFSIALTPMRIRSINTQKVLGSSVGNIRRALVAESILISLAAYILAVGLVALFARSPLSALVTTDLGILSHKVVVGATAFIALCTGLAAGIYPAFYLTSFPPALILKGSFGLSTRGRALRNALIGVQYFASFALIIGAGCMYLQNHFMQHAPLGYERDQIIIAELSDEGRAHPETFMNKMKSYAGVSGITRSEQILSSADSYMTWGRDYRGKQIDYVVIPVEASFLDVLGISVSEGRTFRTEDALTRHGAYVFNERAKQEYGLELGTMIDSTQIVGFMPDVKFASFRNAVEPMAFYVWGKENWGNNSRYVYIRMKAGTDMRAAMEHVQSVLKELDPDYPFNVFFFDKVLQQLYEKERAVGSLITLFSAIAIFISMVGVFGLVVFDSEYKRKEIGIRKVFGSSTRQILVRFNRTYFKIVIVCFVIAAPVAYYGVSQWLTNFAYRTPIRWWIFALAFIAVTAITFFTVTFQNWRAANANPVDSLKSE